mmetsp:Transcript_45029/g.84592  ORF Transcript_45029/g.84592 Transcript_45029/m.84592 type:complete len:826 (-) Transcript_45029:61-2538(-)
MQTIVKDIKSSDGECFDEQVERAVAERHAWFRDSTTSHQQYQQFGTYQNGRQETPNQVPSASNQQYQQLATYQNGRQENPTQVPSTSNQQYQQFATYQSSRQENPNPGKEEELLETRLAEIAQAHQAFQAYSQQALSMLRDTCLEAIRQKQHTITELQMQNQRLQHTQQNGSPGHNSGGTGESPIPRYSYKDNDARVAWNSGDGSSKLRDTAVVVKQPPLYAGPAAPVANAANPVNAPMGEAPKMGGVQEAPVMVETQEVSKNPQRLHESYIGEGVRLARSDTRRASVLVVARNARKTAKLKGHTLEKDQAEAEVVKPVFVDATQMKERVREAIMRPEYNVMNAYKTTGCWQYVARHSWFEHLTLGVIALNAVWIWVDTDLNKAQTLIAAHPVFICAEMLFCFYFSVEITVRFMAFKRKRDCLNDPWFVFDSLLVMMMILETWVVTLVLLITKKESGAGLGNASVLRLVRLLRLTRMARMARLLRAVPEMMILIKGILVAIRSVFFTLLMLAIIIYIFGVAFAQLCKDTPLEKLYFENVHVSMSSLLLLGVLPDLFDFVSRVGQEHIAYSVLLLFFILLSSLTVMNMLVGVLVEVVSVVSSVEKEQMTVQFVKTMLLGLLHRSGIDADCNNHISKAEFESLLLQPEAARIIQEVGVDVVGLVDLADFIFEDGVELSFPEFMEIVLQLRGSNTATVKDIVDLRRFVLTQHAEAISSITTIISDKLDEQVKKAIVMTQVAQVKNNSNISSRCQTPANGESWRRMNGNSNGPRSRPTSGNRHAYRPQSGVSNPQPLPAFPDSMWITELSDGGVSDSGLNNDGRPVTRC